MLIQPEREAFEDAYAAGRAQVMWRRMLGDLETPVSAMLKLGHGEAMSVLFDSVEGGAVRGRYSFIGLWPDAIWRARDGQAEINDRPGEDPDAFRPAGTDVLGSLRQFVEDSRIDLPEDVPPTGAGVLGYMGYDVVRLVESRLGPARHAGLGVPDALFMRPTVMVIFDSVTDLVTIVTPVRPASEVSASAAYDAADARISRVIDRLAQPLPASKPAEAVAFDRGQVTSNTPKARYIEMVEAAKRYIADGDIFQAVLSQRFSLPFPLEPITLYRALRHTNPSPFMFLLNLGGFAIVGSSPEILVRLRDDDVEVRPIAGTRPRGATPEEDRALAADLLADRKELAEHLMLLDLGRNDVGRVAATGTVEVTERNIVERYSHVMHIVSNVRGRIRDGADAIDALLAGFPAGTVSGAPKVRAMEIIDELEADKRGIYAGGIGYFSADGSMDSCIALRTAVVKDGVMHIQAGAGIVADSVPESEHDECRHKAEALVKAAEAALELESFEG